MKPILALDISGSTGWAHGRPDHDPVYGTFYLKFEGENIGRLVRDFGDWLENMIWEAGAGHVVFEAPLVQRMGKRADVSRKLICLAGKVEETCHMNRLTCSEIPIATNKAFFALDGNATKYRMTLAARRYGWDPKNNNESDALGLWAQSVHCRHPEHIADRKLQADVGAR